ncbi:DUF4400 domain-containing protein [Cupriavidus pampae]|uniref:DUF4400 domain-containing protein n=1 Tax=Cupriavidus pampae TaxID=659251 RepID=A0ABM8Y2E5_9BURK|nr:DUF4400 domain-containing protein [Cupriavidus pampae]CAG9186905.1 hypothetical protein LMG32289_06687 [Cupriavidus pampae]
MASRFASHVRLWLFFAPLMICVTVPFLPDKSDFEISESEQTSVTRVLGNARADHAIALANERFVRWFVTTGAVKASFSGSDADTILSDGGTAKLGRNWMRNFWLTIYRGVYRASVAQYWAFGGFVLLCALLNDGAVSRRIRAASAGFANPVTFHVAAHGLLVCFGFGASALLLPLPFAAYWWTVGVAVVGMLSWRLASAFHVGR